MANENDLNTDVVVDSGPSGGERRSPLEVNQLFDRLRSIIRIVSGDRTLDVTTALTPKDAAMLVAKGIKPEDAWFYIEDRDSTTGVLISRRVHVPESIIETSMDVARGKAAHEAAHRAITRTSFIPKHMSKELGFNATLMSAEERATDYTVRKRFGGAGRWVDVARLDNLRVYDESPEQVSSAPRFLQLNDLIVHGRQISDAQLSRLDPEVVAIYDTIREDVREIEETIPSPESNDDKVVASAALRYSKVYQKIWPKIKALVEKDIKDKSQTIARDIDTSQGEFSDEVKATLADIKDLLEIQRSEGQVGQSGPQEQQDSGTSQTQEEPGSQNPNDNNQTQEGSSELTEQELKDKLDQLSEKLFNELPEEVREQLVEQAKELLEKLEDQFTQPLKSELSHDNLPSHEEARQQQGIDESQSSEDQSSGDQNRAGKQPEKPVKVKPKTEGSGLDERMKAVEKAVESLMEGDVYERKYREVSPMIEDLWHKLEPIFFPRKKGTPVLKNSGNQINLDAVFKMEASKGGGSENPDTKIFEVIQNPKTKDYALTILVDLSGSMRGEKITESFKAVIIVSEVLNRLGIKFEILGFQDQLISFKEFTDRLDDSIRKKISGMRLEVESNNPGGHNRASYNDDGPCLDEASERLSKESEKEKIILVLSDGMPNGTHSGEKELRDAITKILTTTDHKLLAVGLGPETNGLEAYYPVATTGISSHDLPGILSSIIEDVLTNPQKYRR